jgi:hypothetical protein
LFSLGLWLLGACHRFPLGHFAHVRLLSFFRAKAHLSPNEALIEASSIAIWERNKFVKTVAIIVWLVNVIAVIQGKSSFLQTIENIVQT